MNMSTSTSFEVFVKPKIFDDIPLERQKQIKEALKELKEPFPSGNKCKIEGRKDEMHRLRVGNYRVFYVIDVENKEVIVKEILTAEQAHKKYERG